MDNRRMLFAKEYIIDLNATQAAIRAGYSEKTAYSQGQRLLKNVEVQAEIQRLMDKRSEKVELTAENILNSIIDIRNTCAAKYEITSKAGDILGETMIDVQGALKANELLGKHLKLFTDKLEIDANIKTKLEDFVD